MRCLAVVVAVLSMQAGAVIAQKPEVPKPGAASDARAHTTSLPPDSKSS